MDRLNGLVNSAAPQRGGRGPLQPNVIFPVGLAGEGAEDDGRSSFIPSPPAAEEDDLPTSKAEEDDYLYGGDYNYRYYDNYGDYGTDTDFYEYGDNTRRKRQHTAANEVKGTQESTKPPGDSEPTGRSSKRQKQRTRKLSMKRRKNAQNVITERDSQERENTQLSHAPQPSTGQQQGDQQAGRGERTYNNRRIENLHPLKAFGLRYRRGLDYLLGKSSKEDITWI